jgi:hypothetical protein
MRNPELSILSIPLLGIVVLVIAVVQPARAASYPEVTVPFELHQVPDSSVYYVVGQSGIPGPENQGFTSNAGFVVTAEGVVVYDALSTPALGYRLLQASRRGDQPPQCLSGLSGDAGRELLSSSSCPLTPTGGPPWARVDNCHVRPLSPSAPLRHP